MVKKIEYEARAVTRWTEGSRVQYLLSSLNKRDLWRVLNVAREAELLQCGTTPSVTYIPPRTTIKKNSKETSCLPEVLQSDGWNKRASSGRLAVGRGCSGSGRVGRSHSHQQTVPARHSTLPECIRLTRYQLPGHMEHWNITHNYHICFIQIRTGFANLVKYRKERTVER